MTAPRTLDEVEQIADPVNRARAAVAYLGRLEERRAAALAVRDAAFRAVDDTAPAVAELVGVTASVVKAARRTKGRR